MLPLRLAASFRPVVLLLVFGCTVAVAQTPPAPGKAEPRLTKQQANELFRSVDEILAFASSDTHLKATRPVKRRLLSRAEVAKDLAKKMDEDEGAKKLERSELVLKKFGLLDRDFHLKPFLLSLLTEQVAAYYEPKTRTVNLMDWVEPAEQKSVLAHELTHALQDDRVKLEKWGDPGPDGVSHSAREDAARIATDEASTAREAVTEGQAMAVFVDYGLKGSGQTLATSPAMGERVQEMAADDSSTSPVLARAPLLLQQSLLFPYSAGLGFVQSLLIAKGVDGAFAGALDRPPVSSHQIIHPRDYIDDAPTPVLTMPDVHGLLDKDWEPYDVGVMGELDVRVMTELFGGRALANPVSNEWAGGIYYAAQRRAASVAEKATPASIATVYLSKWKNRDTARSFMKICTDRLPGKYAGLQAVAVRDGDDDHRLFHTADGDVTLSLDINNQLFITEGFDAATAEKLATLFRDAQGSGTLQRASAEVDRRVRSHSLLAPVADVLKMAAVPRAVVRVVLGSH